MTYKLVTFDNFGTLVDWKGYVEQHMPDKLLPFMEFSGELQTSPAKFMTYSEILKETYLKIQENDADKAEFFATNLGKAAYFDDSLHLQSLQHIVEIGAISNCDYRHQVDVQQGLGINWDHLILTEDLRCYKPGDAAWDKIVETALAIPGVTKDNWLHVAAFCDFDLAPAHKRGIKTAFIARDYHDDDGESYPKDRRFASIYELYDYVGGVNGFPVCYEVAIKGKDKSDVDLFIKWMHEEHGRDLLEVPGCLRYETYRDSEREACSKYLFRNQQALNTYYEKHAETLRAKAAGVFREGALSFERKEVPYSSGYSASKRP